MKRAVALVSFLLVWGLYVATTPVNHTEADVAYRNVLAVSATVAPCEVRADDALYLAAMRGLVAALRWLGWRGDVFDLMVAVSRVAGAATVLLFFRFCYRRFSLRPVSSVLAAGLLAVSYGFWRYSCEAESIVPASFAALMAVYEATAEASSVRRIVFAALWAAAAMLLSVLNVVGLLVVVPLHCLAARRPRMALIYLVATPLAFAVGLLALRALHGPFAGIYGEFLRVWEVRFLDAPSKAAIGFVSSLLSGTFLLGVPAFRDALAAAFPHKMLSEELFLGRSIGPATVVAGGVLLATCLALGAGALALSWRARVRPPPPGEAGSTELPGGRRAKWASALWLAVYVVSILGLQPENPEVWVLGLVPLWLTVCGTVMVPLARSRTLWPVLALMAAMALHNYWGGLRPLRTSAGHLHRARADWLLARASASDAVLVRSRAGFHYWLTGRFPGRVEVVAGWEDPAASYRELTTRHPRVWAFGNLWDLDAIPGTRRDAAEERAVARFVAAAGTEFRRVHEDRFGGIYLREQP